MRMRLALVAASCAAFVTAASPVLRPEAGRHAAHLPSRQSAERLDPRGIDDLGEPAVHGGVQQPRLVRSEGEGEQPRPYRAGAGRELVLQSRPDAAHLQAAPGREVARRQAVHLGRREVHLGRARRPRAEDKALIRKNPRKLWYSNLKEVKTNGDFEVTFVLGRPQPSFLSHARRRLLAGLFLPRARPRDALQADRHRPVQVRRVQAQRVDQAGARTPTTGRRASPISTRSSGRSCPTARTRMLGFQSGEFDMTFDSDVTFPLLKDVKAQKPDAVCEARPTNVSSNLLVNRDKRAVQQSGHPQGDGAGARPQGVQRHPEPGPRSRRRRDAAAARRASGACRKEMLPTAARLRRRHREEPRPRRARSWRRLGYGPDKPLKIKVATRNIAIYRDPAVILIDQLKQIYIEGELEPIDTTVWYTKMARERLSGRHEPDRRRHRRSRTSTSTRTTTATSDRNYTRLQATPRSTS